MIADSYRKKWIKNWKLPGNQEGWDWKVGLESAQGGQLVQPSVVFSSPTILRFQIKIYMSCCNIVQLWNFYHPGHKNPPGIYPFVWMNTSPAPGRGFTGRNRKINPGSGISPYGGDALNETTIKLYGTSWCGHSRRSRRILMTTRFPISGLILIWTRMPADLSSPSIAGCAAFPPLSSPDGDILVEPSDDELKKKWVFQNRDQSFR